MYLCIIINLDRGISIITTLIASNPSTPLYGVTDEERETMLDWAKDDRLPYFLQ